MSRLNKRWFSNILILFVLGCLLLMAPLDVSAQVASNAIPTGSAWLLNARYGMGIWEFNAPPNPQQTEFTTDDYTKTYIRDSLESMDALISLNVEIVDYH